jgi:hypothetical protein
VCICRLGNGPDAKVQLQQLCQQLQPVQGRDRLKPTVRIRGAIHIGKDKDLQDLRFKVAWSGVAIVSANELRPPPQVLQAQGRQPQVTAMPPAGHSSPAVAGSGASNYGTPGSGPFSGRSAAQAAGRTPVASHHLPPLATPGAPASGDTSQQLEPGTAMAAAGNASPWERDSGRGRGPEPHGQAAAPVAAMWAGILGGGGGLVPSAAGPSSSSGLAVQAAGAVRMGLAAQGPARMVDEQQGSERVAGPGRHPPVLLHGTADVHDAVQGAALDDDSAGAQRGGLGTLFGAGIVCEGSAPAEVVPETQLDDCAGLLWVDTRNS